MCQTLSDANRPRCASKTRLLRRQNGFYTDIHGDLPARAPRRPPRRHARRSSLRPAFEDSLATTRVRPVTQVVAHSSPASRRTCCGQVGGAERAYQRDDDHDPPAVRPCHRRADAVGVARVKSSRRLPVGPATAPRASDVEVDHSKDVPHVLRFAYFLPAGPPARETCKNSRRRDERRQRVLEHIP